MVYRRYNIDMLIGCRTSWCVAMAVMFAAAWPVWAQSGPEELGGEAVERLVEDVEPLAISLRDPNLGLDTISGGNRVWRWTRGDGEERFFFVDGGLVAEFGRSEYRLFELDQDVYAIGQVASPGTVYHIGMPTELMSSMSSSGRAGPPAGAIVSRVDREPMPLKPIFLTPASSNPGVGQSAVNEFRWMDTTWVSYLESRAYQRAAVADAIDRALQRGPG